MIRRRKGYYPRQRTVTWPLPTIGWVKNLKKTPSKTFKKLYVSLYCLPAPFQDSCLGGDSCCRWNGYRCGEGEGDCDSDFDCKLGLVCGKDNCKNPKNITGMIFFFKYIFGTVVFPVVLYNLLIHFHQCINQDKGHLDIKQFKQLRCLLRLLL